VIGTFRARGATSPPRLAARLHMIATDRVSCGLLSPKDFESIEREAPMRRIVEWPRRRMLAGSFILLAAFVFSGCATEENEEDDCEKTKKEEIEPLFRIYFAVTKTGDIPYTGEMNFQSEKHYCDGTVKGVFTDHIDGTADGNWKPITTQYKLANEKDYVFVQFSTATYTATHLYYYREVSAGMELEDYTTWVFEDTLHIVVPL
jgi:hypothetical protein